MTVVPTNAKSLREELQVAERPDANHRDGERHEDLHRRLPTAAAERLDRVDLDLVGRLAVALARLCPRGSGRRRRLWQAL